MSKIVKGVFGTVGGRKSQAGGGADEKWLREGAGPGRIINYWTDPFMLDCLSRISYGDGGVSASP